MTFARVLARVPGEDGEDGDGNSDGGQPGCDAGEDRNPPALAATPLPLLPTPAPVDDRSSKRVVVDLVAAVTGRTQDAHLPGEAVDHLRDLLRRRLGVVGEVRDPVGDLRPGGSDEVTEGSPGQVLVAGRQRGESDVEMRAHDSLGAAEPLERLQTEESRFAPSLLVPEACEHELKVRRLDASALVGRGGAVLAECDLARRHLVEHGLNQRRLDLHLLTGPGNGAVPVLKRLDDRLARCIAVEMLEP